MKKCIILANGKPPERNVISFLMKNKYSTLFCADGGANTAMKMGLSPTFIIGDFDSIHKEAVNHYLGKTKFIKMNRQNDTDVEKCLKFAIKKKFDYAILLGVTGDRLDHTFCNLGIVIKFFDKIIIKIIADNSILAAFTGIHKITTVPGEIISLYGIDNKTKITSSGLKYSLKTTTLPFGYRESTSNIAIRDSVELKITGGIIFVIRDFKTMKNHGLI